MRAYLIIRHLLAQREIELRLVFLVLESRLERNHDAVHEEVVKLYRVCVLMLLLKVACTKQNESAYASLNTLAI